MRVYVDTNVFISAIRDEIGSNFTLLGQDSRLFFAACAKKELIVLISDLVMFEIFKKVKIDEVDVFGFLEEQGIAFEYINTSQENKSLAQKIQTIAGIHYLDALHAAIATDKECNYLITWNMKDFEKAEKWIKPFQPDSFLRIL